MSDPGPLPPPPRRPRWLLILLGIFGACLLICVGVVIWTQTLGREFVEGWVATAEVFLTATAEAGSPAVGTPGGAATPAGAGSGLAATPAVSNGTLVSGTPLTDVPILRIETPTPD